MLNRVLTALNEFIDLLNYNMNRCIIYYYKLPIKFLNMN